VWSHGHQLLLSVLRGRYALCRLGPTADVPTWATGELASVTRTRAELSIICVETAVPAGVQQVAGYVVIGVEGPLAPEIVGVLASMAGPLAEAGIPIVAIGTFDTDYVMVRAVDLDHALRTLRQAGHTIASTGS
jgi:uncharacterized protein